MKWLLIIGVSINVTTLNWVETQLAFQRNMIFYPEKMLRVTSGVNKKASFTGEKVTRLTGDSRCCVVEEL